MGGKEEREKLQMKMSLLRKKLTSNKPISKGDTSNDLTSNMFSNCYK
jgi:hypothetical protein